MFLMVLVHAVATALLRGPVTCSKGRLNKSLKLPKTGNGKHLTAILFAKGATLPVKEGATVDLIPVYIISQN
jgi:hypothetical protein